MTLLAETTDDKPKCDGVEDTGLIVFDIEYDSNYDPDVVCGNARTCNLSPIECMTGDYRNNFDAIFGEKTDLKKWYVEIQAKGKCDDGSNYTQIFVAGEGKNLSAQLNSAGNRLEFYTHSSTELYVNRNITFTLTIREPCREHTEDCLPKCLDQKYLNISSASTFATNVRSNQTKYFIASVDENGEQCGCSL